MSNKIVEVEKSISIFEEAMSTKLTTVEESIENIRKSIKSYEIS